MSVPFIHSEREGREELVVILNGKSRSVVKGDPKYNLVRKAIQMGETADEIEKIFSGVEVLEANVEQTVNDGRLYFDDGSDSGLAFRGGKLMVRNTEVDETLRDEIVSLIADDMPADGMINLVLRLYDSVVHPNGKRVSARVRSELLDFSKRNGIVVDSNGDIIAYKAVKENYYDKHTGKTFKNTPGTRVWMDFGDVDDDALHGCSSGLHAGSLEYVSSFGYGNDRIVVVRIDPADVVSVPKDCSCQKLRCCAYTVIGDYEGELKQKVYHATDDASEMYDRDEELYSSDYDEEDDGWDEMDDLDDWHHDGCDDVYLESDIHTKQVEPKPVSGSIYGVKPSGHKFYNRRGPDGKFSSN